MKIVLKIIGVLVIVAASLAALGTAVMLLWNWILPDTVVGISAITFWQALGLFALCRLLIGGLGFHKRGPGSHLHRHFHDHRDKWLKMTPKERHEFVKRRRHHHFGDDCCGAKTSEKQEESGD